MQFTYAYNAIIDISCIKNLKHWFLWCTKNNIILINIMQYSVYIFYNSNINEIFFLI